MPVVKSKTRKDASFRQLVEYIHNHEKDHSFEQLVGYIHKEAGRNAQSQTLLHNLNDIAADDTAAIIEAFQENDSFRRQRKNGVVQYHEIISFSPKDREILEKDPDILLDLASKYLSLRAPGSLAIARPHFDKEHVHVHLMISGNQYRSSQPSRISQKEFNQVKQELNEYQLEHYPELANSLIEEHHKRKMEKDLNTEREVEEKSAARLMAINNEVLPEPERGNTAELELDMDDAAELELEFGDMVQMDTAAREAYAAVTSPYYSIPSPYWEQDGDIHEFEPGDDDTDEAGIEEEADDTAEDDSYSMPSLYWGQDEEEEDEEQEDEEEEDEFEAE